MILVLNFKAKSELEKIHGPVVRLKNYSSSMFIPDSFVLPPRFLWCCLWCFLPEAAIEAAEEAAPIPNTMLPLTLPQSLPLMPSKGGSTRGSAGGDTEAAPRLTRSSLLRATCGRVYTVTDMWQQPSHKDQQMSICWKCDRPLKRGFQWMKGKRSVIEFISKNNRGRWERNIQMKL